MRVFSTPGSLVHPRRRDDPLAVEGTPSLAMTIKDSVTPSFRPTSFNPVLIAGDGGGGNPATSVLLAFPRSYRSGSNGIDLGQAPGRGAGNRLFACAEEKR